MYTVYAIASLHRKYIYVGMTNSLIRRIKEHQEGKERTTKPYRPFVLIFAEEFSRRVDARVREKYLKSGIGKDYLKNIQHARVAKLADALP